MKFLPSTNEGRVQITTRDLDISHIYRTRNVKSNVVIVRFKSRALRNDNFKLKKKLKGYKTLTAGKPITITEHLTSRNFSLGRIKISLELE